ncbi:MAG: hypothetical protein JW384_02184 [Nitrosomonadaceae bacterium]|nr:hypothetical protein [Nitrosomonadaceae bacterium]
MRASTAQHIPDQQLTGIACSDYQDPASRGAQYVKPFAEPANGQLNASKKQTTEYTRENNDRA